MQKHEVNFIRLGVYFFYVHLIYIKIRGDRKYETQEILMSIKYLNLSVHKSLLYVK